MSVDEPVRGLDRTELVGGPPATGSPWAASPGPQTPTTPPGWHPDPSNPQGAVRWWDGQQWTGYVHAAQAPAQTPLALVPAPLTPGDPDELYRVTLSKVTSVIILTTRRATTYTGSYEQLRRASRNVLIYNLLLGWWGFPFGLIWTPMTLIRNAGAMKRLKQLSGQV